MAGYQQLAVNGERDETFPDDAVGDGTILAPHRVDQGGIPLICYACEKIPTFSDLSHLLTHVSSKTHLLELYHLRLKSYGDEASAARARKFETWNSAYNIDQLVRQRMEARDEKGAQLQRRGQPSRDASSGRSTPRRGSRGNRGRRSSSNARGRNHGTAHLSHIKYDPDEALDFGEDYEELVTPSIPPWQHDPSSFNALMHRGDRDVAPQDFGDLGDDNVSLTYDSSDHGSPFASENVADNLEFIEADTGALGLKGVVYPGMGLFDAAKEEQRRRRNQRKPPAVLQQLEINSTLVTTEEEVYDCDFNHQRSRDVYDEPSIDGSEDEEEEEDDGDRRRKRRSTQAHSAAVKKAKPSYIPRTTRATTKAMHQASRQARLTDNLTPFTRGRSSNSGGRMVGSAVNHGSAPQAQMGLHNHNHGFQGEMGMYHDPMGVPNGSTDPTRSPPRIRRRQQDRMPGLVLRPGNPNNSFTSSSPSIKRSPTSQFHRQENNSLSLKSATTSSNPYLTSTNSTPSESYNPLYVQPREEFRMFSSYDENSKAPANGFNAINSHDAFNSLQMSSHHNSNFPSNQAGNSEFGM